VVRADVQGSAEAIAGALEKVGNEEVAARIVQRASAASRIRRHAGGGLRRHHPGLQRARPQGSPRGGRARGLEIRYYNIIYDLVDDVKAAMSGLLPPTLREERLGEAQILEIFNVSKVGKIAGCRVLDGKVERGANVRLIRDNVVVHEGGSRSSSASRTTRGGHRRPGMRHGLRELPGHARRRRDRVLPGGGGAADAVRRPAFPPCHAGRPP
jgi:translation initiation factor IF-2